MLEIEQSCLVIVDVQGKLAQLMWEKERLFRNIGILITACGILEIPILWCQQVPEALGPTVPEIAGLLEGQSPIDKAEFSCWGSDEFSDKLGDLGRRQVMLCGIESHVCVYQTAADLLGMQYQVDVISDAVSSRTAENREVALRRMVSEGARLSSVEMALFELLQNAKHPKFREVAKLVK
jgi:nicotinamidase-related amidase